ncbi:ethanolamine ammonia-lyase subunit EutC [Psychromonas sp. KJ10-10]|uniref:ethanolamine ammonia-lyase subunit EutC n=1 Tax=Psychromonas sp. KJ10-10 TaxID=3391823 RepID=UPI0039B48ECD
MSKTPEKTPLNKSPLVTENEWQALKQFTSARIALGRSGNSIPTNQQLSFQLDHARAIDAVHRALDVAKLVQEFSQSKVLQNAIGALPNVVNSKATDRMMYLQRPDLGRQINEACWQLLIDIREENSKTYDIAIVVADGLSSTAIQKHALPVIERLVGKLACDKNYDWSIAPLTIITQGRVASGDDVGECLKAKVTLILIGERPGLTSPDSMGIYMTWNPKRGAKDASRNCISNIRPEGLGYDEASEKAFYLLSEAIKLQISGITLKDRSGSSDEFETLQASSTENFLIPPKS